MSKRSTDYRCKVGYFKEDEFESREGGGWSDGPAASDDPIEAIDAELKKAVEKNNHVVLIKFYKAGY